MQVMRFWFDCEFIDADALDLISIGMVAEDNRRYYAISADFDPTKANQWVKDKVLAVLGTEERKSKYQIRDDLIEFVGTRYKPEFWSFCGAYDWVILCRLFGGLMSLPQHWTYSCRELKQWAADIGAEHIPKMEGGTQHNALSDALWHRDIWNYIDMPENRQACLADEWHQIRAGVFRGRPVP